MNCTTERPAVPLPEARSAGYARLRGRLQLLAVCLLLAAVWLLVLPWAARQPGMRDAIRRNEALGIDPAATYYTELDAMDTILQRMQSLHRSRSRVLWHRHPAESPPRN